MGLLKVCNSLGRQQSSGSLKNRLCNHLKEKYNSSKLSKCIGLPLLSSQRSHRQSWQRKLPESKKGLIQGFCNIATHFPINLWTSCLLHCLSLDELPYVWKISVSSGLEFVPKKSCKTTHLIPVQVSCADLVSVRGCSTNGSTYVNTIGNLSHLETQIGFFDEKYGLPWLWRSLQWHLEASNSAHPQFRN